MGSRKLTALIFNYRDEEKSQKHPPPVTYLIQQAAPFKPPQTEPAAGNQVFRCPDFRDILFKSLHVPVYTCMEGQGERGREGN